jgi:peptidoglycan/LPS O-acetylase OafA/YrhL
LAFAPASSPIESKLTAMTTATAVPAAPASTRGSGFRPDVEGLRAIAVGTVLWFHAGLGGLSGGFAGVDIFFVISGFLITGQLVREVERTGRIALPRFYARRAKRLFPAAATVLVTTAVLTLLFLPKVAWREFGGDIAAAAAYVVNWRLAARSVDYLAEDSTASPVQHFWSLAVEEQYYIIWPVLLLALAGLIRARRWPVRTVMAAGLSAIVIPSLAWSIYLTQADPARAYFVTTTRLWELGIGALVAVGATLWTRLAPPLGAAIAWGGLVLIGGGTLPPGHRHRLAGRGGAGPRAGDGGRDPRRL